MNHHSRFDLDERLEPLVAYLRALKTQQACSMVLWGEISSKTLNEVKSVEQQIHEEFDKAVREGQAKIALEEKQLAEALRQEEKARRRQLERFEARAEDRRDQRGNIDSKESGNVYSNLSEEDQIKRIAYVIESLRSKPQPSSQSPEFRFYERPRPIGRTFQPQRFSGPVRERYRRPNK